MNERNIVYGFSPLGLIFMTESRALELSDFYKALVTAKNWGEFRKIVSREIYEFYLPESMHYQGPSDGSFEDLEPFYIPDEIPFTPNDIFTFDHLPGDPKIEMAQWMPIAIQEEFGRRLHYTAMDMNVPIGEVLELDETKVDEIVQALEERGFMCRQDDELILAATTSDYDPDEFDDPND